MSRALLVLELPGPNGWTVRFPILGKPRVEPLPASGTTERSAALSDVAAVRVLVSTGVFYRLLELPGVRGSSLAEAARYAAEPGLPLPLSDLRTVAMPAGRRARGRVLLAAIPEQAAAAALAYGLEQAPRPGIPVAVLPTLTVLPPVDGYWSGAGWAGVAREGGWRSVGAGRTEADARTSAGEAEAAWRAADPRELALAAARAPVSRGWTRAGVEAAADTGPRRWPRVLAATAAALILVAFALRHHAASQRLDAAAESIAASFAESMPGSTPVAPAEQIRRSLAGLKREHAALGERLARRGSALAGWTLVDQAAPPVGLRLDDFRWSSEGARATGSAASPEIILEFVKQLNARAADLGLAVAFPEPETRRSAAGLGVDFSLRGNFTATPEGSPRP